MSRTGLWLFVALTAGMFQNAPPDTEIFLATVAVEAGKITLGTPVNISSSPGYDNQPSFTPDGRAVLFTSVRGSQAPNPANTAQTGSDIYRYDFASQRVSQVTATPESEYSPHVVPDGKSISVVRVEADGTQRLWRFGLDGAKPEIVLADVKPVGYYAWADAHTVAVFVLGAPATTNAAAGPATLHLADVRTGRAQQVARDIGRSVQRIPGGGVSYVQRAFKDGAAIVTVMRLEPATGESRPLVPMIQGVRDPDLAWTPDGTLLVAHAGKLYGWRAGSADFTVVADLEALGLRSVSRLAISPGGDRIALVAQK